MVKPFLSKNAFFFQLLSTITTNRAAKIMQSAYLCVIYHVKHKKSHHFSRFKPDFQFLVKSKMAAAMATIVGDVTGLQQRHHL